MSKKPSPSRAAELKPFVAPFRFDGASEFHLRSQTTREKGGLDKDKGEKILEANRKHLSDFQERLYAQDRWSLLLIVQGMRDPNVTPENLAAVRRALDEAKIPYEVLTFDDEGHGIRKRANNRVLYRRLADFFEAAFAQPE